MEVMEEIDFTSGSQTTEEERTGFTIDKCILKGLPDCVCMLNSEEKTIVIFCAEEKNEPVSLKNNITERRLDRTLIGQLLFYLLCHSLNSFPHTGNQLGLYMEANKGLLCWAYLSHAPYHVLERAGLTKKIHKEAIYYLNLRIAGVGEGGIDLLSVMGIHSLQKQFFHFIQKGFADESM